MKAISMAQTPVSKKPTPSLKTPAAVKADFASNGVSIAKWAAQHKVNRQLVYEILSGRKRIACRRGQSHRIAVLLGLKHGVLTDMSSTHVMNVVPDRLAA
jgi:gp16 family phage-associated protein